MRFVTHSYDASEVGTQRKYSDRFNIMQMWSIKRMYVSIDLICGHDQLTVALSEWNTAFVSLVLGVEVRACLVAQEAWVGILVGQLHPSSSCLGTSLTIT